MENQAMDQDPWRFMHKCNKTSLPEIDEMNPAKIITGLNLAAE